MKKTHVKRIASILMSLVLCVAFTMTTTVQADAAVRTKTYQVVTEAKTVYKSGGVKQGTDIVKYSYNKSGLRTAEEYDGNRPLSKTTFKRNKKGYVTEVMRYDKRGKLANRTVYKYKSNGNISTATEYNVNGKKSTKSCTDTYKYRSRGKVKLITTTGEDDDYTYVNKYDKKGYLTSISRTWGSGKDKSTEKRTRVIEYDEKGNPVKETLNRTNVDQGTTTKYKDVNKYKYTYNKEGNLIKTVSKWVSYENGKKQGSGTVTTTYKYKSVKVPEKYWDIYKYKLDPMNIIHG